MRILHIVFNRVGQGSYWRAYHFGKHLVRRGHEVTVMATSPTAKTGIQVSHLDGMRLVQTPDFFSGPLRSGWDGWNVFNRLLWLRNQEFDLVYAIEARPTVIYPSLYLHRRKNIPFVLGWSDWFGRGGSVEERSNPIIRTVLRPVETYFEENFRTEADGSTVICTTLHNKALQLGVDPQSIRLIPDGCDLDLFSNTSIEQARVQTGLEPNYLFIGYVGSIFRKDAELMASAFDQVVEQNPLARLLVVGYCPISIGLLSRYPHSVIQTGPVSAHELNQYLASCDLFWLPLHDTNANRGRWPHKLNDYFALGRATIATAVGDVKPIFEQEAVGLLSNDQPDDFSKQTLQLLENEDQRYQMGKRARQLAETRFHWENLTNELEHLYNESIIRHAKH